MVSYSDRISMQTTIDGKKVGGEHLVRYATAKKIVEYILKVYPQTRNNNKQLIRECIIFCLDNDIKVPAYDTITRARRKLNEDGLYLPDDHIAEKRKEKERFMRTAAEKGLL